MVIYIYIYSGGKWWGKREEGGRVQGLGKREREGERGKGEGKAYTLPTKKSHKLKAIYRANLN